MSFSADWLTLRRGADLRARNRELAAALTSWAATRAHPVRVLDLGAGTGANLAATAPALGDRQHWRLVDNDAGLLARVTPPASVTVETVVADLAAPMDALFDPVPDLVTASAFFDLCGAALINQLVALTTQADAAFYTVLSYDGRETWAPPHPADTAVLAAFHTDQRSDKGLGPALGPDATAHLDAAFRAAGYVTRTGPSDWHLDAPRDGELIAALAAGSAAAAEPQLGQTARDWGMARADASSVMIGHLDFLALPPA
ncbi:MAG: SAM-dependent methyltransferase [Pseudomonadota bacterium]